MYNYVILPVNAICNSYRSQVISYKYIYLKTRIFRTQVVFTLLHLVMYIPSHKSTFPNTPSSPQVAIFNMYCSLE